MKTKVALAHIYAASNRKQEAENLLHDIFTNHMLGENDYRGMALVYVALEDIESAFDWLEKSYERREPALSSLLVDPKLDPIRNDPRMNVLIGKIGLRG